MKSMECLKRTIKLKSRNYISPITENFLHSKGVGLCAYNLAIKFSLDPVAAFIGGSLHDLGGVIPNNLRIQIAQSCNIPLEAEELAHPLLIHAKQGAYFAKNLLDIDNIEIIEGILYHTTCIGNASDLVKTIFIADKIQWDRNGVPPYLEGLYCALSNSLDEGCAFFLEWLWKDENKLVVHPYLKNSYNYYVYGKDEKICKWVLLKGQVSEDILNKFYINEVFNEYKHIFSSIINILDHIDSREKFKLLDEYFQAAVLSNCSNTVSSNACKLFLESNNVDYDSSNFRNKFNVFIAKSEYSISSRIVLKNINDAISEKHTDKADLSVLLKQLQEKYNLVQRRFSDGT